MLVAHHGLKVTRTERGKFLLKSRLEGGQIITTRRPRSKQQKKKDQRQKSDQCNQCGEPEHEDGDDSAPKDEKGEDAKGEGEQPSDCPNNQPGYIDGQPDLTDMGEAFNGETFGHCGSAGGNTLENEEGLSQEAQKAERSEAEMEIIRRQAAEEMADQAKDHPGSIPGGLERWVKDLLGPPAPSEREEAYHHRKKDSKDPAREGRHAHRLGNGLYSAAA